ncbi:hypothetical protein [Spirosoma agri]|uniref:Capsid protein n=1 Tax=Spirosoma agri TaxID=1987381 RepID=A0A6M0IID7_9BACT|nr:hypothetical protein [Spirosoma agri]NEU67954.1 hypothetical protein [Spirosoma agri]
MSVIQAPHNLTFNAKEATEYIWLPAMALTNLEDWFKVLTGVNTKTQVAFAQRPSKITQRDQGCDPVFNDPRILRSEKFWDPQAVEATLKQCYTDLFGTFHERTLRPGTDRPNIEGTDSEKVILDAMIPASAEDLLRMVWLSDRDIIGSSLTAGAGDVKNYNQVNGLWKKAIVAVASGRTPRYVIAKNAASTTAGQLITPDDAYAILTGVYYGQKLVMKQRADKEKRFFVTRNVNEGYFQWLVTNKQLESNRALLTDGSDVLKFMGIRLEIVDVVDTYLAADFTFGSGANTTITNPTRVMLAIRDNLQVSLDTPTTNPVVFDSWYERKEKRWYADAMYMLDTQIAIEEYISVGY